MVKFTIKAKGTWNVPTVKPDEVVTLVSGLFSKDMCSSVEIYHTRGIIERRALSRGKHKIQIFIGALLKPSRRYRNPQHFIETLNERMVGPYMVRRGLYYNPRGSLYSSIIQSPSGSGQRAMVLAGIVRNSIFIFNDLNSSAPGDEMELLRYTLRRVIVGMQLDENSTDNEIAEIIMRRASTMRDVIRDKMVATEDAIANKKRQLTALYNEQTCHEKELSIIESLVLDEIVGKTKDMMSHTRKVPGIISIRLSDNDLVLCTDTITVKDPRTNILHEIGRFKITIDVRTGYTVFENKTRRVTGYQPGMHAPHVFADGHACWGNLEGVIPVYIAKWEIEAVAVVCMEFLRSVNTGDSAGTLINRWPAVKEKS